MDNIVRVLYYPWLEHRYDVTAHLFMVGERDKVCVRLGSPRLVVPKALESGSNEAVVRYLWKVIPDGWKERSCPEFKSQVLDYKSSAFLSGVMPERW